MGQAKSDVTGASSASGTTAGMSHPGYGGAAGASSDFRQAEDNTNSSDIKTNIDHTRAEMDETIDQLSRRLQPRSLLRETLEWAGLNPQHAQAESTQSLVSSIAAEVLASMREAMRDSAKSAARKTGVKAWDTLCRHPLPAGVIGAGMAWLAYETATGKSGTSSLRDWTMRRRIEANREEPSMYGGSYVDARTGEPYDRESYTAPIRKAKSGPGMMSRVSEAASSTASSALHGVTGGAKTAADQASSALHSATDTLRGAASRTTSSVRNAASSMDWTHMPTNLLDTVRQNPVPAALIGAGVAWLLLGNRARSAYYGARIHRHGQEPPMYGGSYVDARTGEPYDRATYEQQGGAADSGEGAKGAIGGAASKLSSAASSAAEAARSLRERAKERASGARHTMRETAASAKYRVRSRAHSVRERAGATSEYLREATDRVSRRASTGYEYGRDRFWETLDDYPLAMGAAALGVGLLVGLAAPRTRKEEELIGERARELKERARQAGREVVQRGRQAVQATAQAVSEEVRNQALTPEGVKSTAQDLVSRLKEEAQGVLSGEALATSLKDKISHVADRAKDTMKNEAKEAASAIKEQATQSGGETQDKAGGKR